MSVAEKLAKNGPRKLLALDGGGIRGLIAIEVLAEIERLLQVELGRGDDFTLAEYFDYIGGTSTGAIIATCLALGMRVERVREFYLTSGEEMFAKARLVQRFRFKYAETRLAGLLKAEIGADTLLGSDKVRTLLLLVLRNATTDSPWPISNNPRALYNRRDHPGCNLDFPLWQLIRASTAAPTYFPPEVIEVGGRRFVFVDGGVTVYNNPAFQLFTMAAAEPYRLSWPTGIDQMLLVSIGTGTAIRANVALRPRQMNLLYNVSSVPAALITAAMSEQDLLCRLLGDCLVGDPIDREVGDLIGGGGLVEDKLFTYLRYNADLSREGLDALGLPGLVPTHVQRMDATTHMADVRRVGEATARKIRREHFARFLA